MDLNENEKMRLAAFESVWNKNATPGELKLKRVKDALRAIDPAFAPGDEHLMEIMVNVLEDECLELDASMRRALSQSLHGDEFDIRDPNHRFDLVNNFRVGHGAPSTRITSKGKKEHAELRQKRERASATPSGMLGKFRRDLASMDAADEWKKVEGWHTLVRPFLRRFFPAEMDQFEKNAAPPRYPSCPPGAQLDASDRSAERAERSRIAQEWTSTMILFLDGLLATAGIVAAADDSALGEVLSTDSGFPVLSDEYEPLRNVGFGGFGKVYLYRQRMLDLEVAVKVLAVRSRDATEKDVGRFHGEARNLFHLRHPCIIAVHSMGKTRAGDPYIVMDFFPGKSLSEWMKAGRREPAVALERIERLADGMAHAHARGVLHRDLKPSNVLYSESGDCRIIDFGLAILVETERANRFTATGQGPIGGRYTAPELERDPRCLHKQSDVYSIGALWFEMIAGSAPGTNVSKKLRDECPTLAPDYEATLIRCLDDNLDARYADASELLEAVRGLRSAESVVAEASTPVSVAALEALASAGARSDPVAPAQRAYDRAVELLRNGDTLGWRQLVRTTRAQLGPNLMAWRSIAGVAVSGEATTIAPTAPTEETFGQFDGVFAIAAPAFVVALAAVDSDSPSNRPEVRDFFPEGWNSSNRMSADVPAALAFLYHHLVGALSISARRHAEVAALLRTPVRGIESVSPLIRAPDVMAWPRALGGSNGAHVPYGYLLRLFRSTRWLEHFFATEREFELSVRAYGIFASVLELSTFPYASLADFETANFNVPPVFLQGIDDAALADALLLAFPEPRTLEVLASGREAVRIRGVWPVWLNSLLKWLGRNSRGGPYPLLRQELPPLP